MSARVLAVGQRMAGDDGVGPAVAARVRGTAGIEVVEVVEVTDAAALVDALAGGGVAVVVDALLGPDAPGTVRVLDPHELSRSGEAGPCLATLSSHGLDVPTAIALAEVLYPGKAARVHVVGVVIARAERFHEGLSAEVEAAVERAAEAVIALARPSGGTGG